MHEYTNGPQRTMLFLVRYGAAMFGRRVSWDTRPGWKQTDEDIGYFRTRDRRAEAAPYSPPYVPRPHSAQ